MPLEVAQTSFQVFELAKLMVDEGNPNSVSDVGVAGDCAYTAVRGACLNVLINLSGVESDSKFVKTMQSNVEQLLKDAENAHAEIFNKTREVIGK